MPHYAVNVNHHKCLLNIMKCEFSGNIYYIYLGFTGGDRQQYPSSAYYSLLNV